MSYQKIFEPIDNFDKPFKELDRTWNEKAGVAGSGNPLFFMRRRSP
jgi:hypothetical protein